MASSWWGRYPQQVRAAHADDGGQRAKPCGRPVPDVRRCYEHDTGAAYGLEFLPYHVEAFYLPGEDATFVYDLTSGYILELATQLAGWRANRVGMKAIPA